MGGGFLWLMLQIESNETVEKMKHIAISAVLVNVLRNFWTCSFRNILMKDQVLLGRFLKFHSRELPFF